MYRRLLILDPPPIKKSVSFSDLNEVRTYRDYEPPVQVANRPEVEVLRERVKRLEQKIEKLTYQPSAKRKDQENMPQCIHIPANQASAFVLPPVPPIDYKPNSPGSTRSVTSPYRPVSTSRATQSRTDNLPPPMPAHLHRAIRAANTAPAAPAKIRDQAQPVAHQQAQPAQPIPSRAKRFVLALSALATVAAVPALIAGLVALGPVGLAVGAGVAAFGMALMAVGHRMK